MRAKDVVVDAQEIIDKLDQLKRGSWSDPDLLQYAVGEVGKPAKNIIRPVGMFVSCRVHYVQDYIGDEEGVDSVPVCPGRKKCPICKQGSYLYNLGTEAAKERAKDFYSTERNYWNVIPRWDYEWGEQGPGCKVLSFGTKARQALTKLVEDYGNPGDIEEGFDIVYEVGKKKGGKWNEYDVYPVKKRVRRQGEISEVVKGVALDDDELEYELIDLSKYTAKPSDKVLSRLADIFEVEVGTTKGKRRREEVEDDEDEVEDLDDDEDDIDEDEEEDDDDFLCFGDSQIYDPEAKLCGDCPYLERCGKKVKLEKINARRKT